MAYRGGLVSPMLKSEFILPNSWHNLFVMLHVDHVKPVDADKIFFTLCTVASVYV